MNCQNCGYNLAQNDQVCPVCGAPVVQQPAPEQIAYAQQPVPEQNTYAQQPSCPVFNPETLPEQYRPLSAWAYFALQLLYSVPIVGFIFLIIFSFNGGNVHRRSHARSQWIGFIIVAAIALIFLLFYGAMAATIIGGSLRF